MNDIKIYEECDTVIVIGIVHNDTLISKTIDSDEIASTRWVNLSEIPTLHLRDIFRKLYGTYISVWEEMATKTDS